MKVELVILAMLGFALIGGCSSVLGDEQIITIIFPGYNSSYSDGPDTMPGGPGTMQGDGDLELEDQSCP